MFQISSRFGSKKISEFMGIFGFKQSQRTELLQKQFSWLEQGGGFDIVSFSGEKSERYEDVLTEMRNNLPKYDECNTEQKEKCIEYIDRLLQCSDLPNPEYWKNNKDSITMDIVTEKNNEKIGKESDWKQIAEEWKNSTGEYWNKKPVFENVAERVEYYKSYYNMYISYCDRMLACDNLPDDGRSQWNDMKNGALYDLNNHLRDLDNYNKENDQQSESFNDVRAELAENVPDSTSTVEEKEKAISYIDRMLNCSDITPEMKNYWSNKKDIIQMEIQMINNQQQAEKESNYQSVVAEFRDFIDKHWCDSYPTERNSSLEFTDSEEYGLTFYNTCLTYINRILACDDLPEKAKNDFEQEFNHWNAEKQFRLGEINWHNQNRNVKTESFYDVYAEFDRNVPDSTSTLEEKKLASAYIKRMLMCDDIPFLMKNYWSDKQDVIQKEMEALRNNLEQ